MKLSGTLDLLSTRKIYSVKGVSFTIRLSRHPFFLDRLF